MPKQTKAQQEDTLLSDEEVRERLLANPEIRARAEELARRVRSKAGKGPSVAAKDLADFLREHGMDSRQGRLI